MKWTIRIPALAVMFYLIGLMLLVVDWTLMDIPEIAEPFKQIQDYVRGFMQ
ncbi:hypothetical protein [Terribacillus sp. JSM ZJ617]|uniref:hypothetical protein n=1 Tax=Terribacillus sp. JSM ZJ617 TaxID=3342119 RepID=UPI0035A82C98